MTDLPKRLSDSITTLIAQFKMRPDGPYEGLSLVETSIVANIAVACSPAVQGDIGSALRLPKTTMTSAVSRLQTKGLVERMQCVDDKRVRVLTLTKAGRTLADSLALAQVQSSEAMLNALPQEDRETLVRLLEQVADTIREQD
ncbi:MarR family winged helix-turn-helix transcriptional regulator [Loktanella sp. M215]|uniref:MarR family winged helix-turn-helix transcriptional regulator n=1 Tax=Loktanella sp. M215 TaxID=2675431 RepID=UPI001F474161|nr:MarR family winged helix-turn-helix transcriptional regulator [Loktanella sp. M215]